MTALGGGAWTKANSRDHVHLRTIYAASPSLVWFHGATLGVGDDPSKDGEAFLGRLPRSLGVHALRHTFCSHLAMRGAPAKVIQELAGHQNLATTQRYMHLTPATLDATVRLLDQPENVPAVGDIMETGRV